MKAIIHANDKAHQTEAAAWMTAGFDRHGVDWEMAEFDTPAHADFAVVWGWRQGRVKRWCAERGMPLLLMERGHMQPREEFTSLGWDGLSGRGRYPEACDGRWEKHWGEMAPWNTDGSYFLICGQVDGDASLEGTNFNAWAQKTTDTLLSQGYDVSYRPHPLMVTARRFWRPAGARLSVASLADDLGGAAGCATFNSTVGVEAVLAGVPTVTCDEGAMAWDVTTHDAEDILVMPDRLPWARRMACCQWSRGEIESGEAWAAVREVM